MSELTRLWREYCRTRNEEDFGKIYSRTSHLTFFNAYKVMNDKWKAIHITEIIYHDLKTVNFTPEKLAEIRNFDDFLAEYIPFVCLRENL